MEWKKTGTNEGTAVKMTVTLSLVSSRYHYSRVDRSVDYGAGLQTNMKLEADLVTLFTA